MTESKRKKMAQKNREKIIKMTQQLLLKKGSTGAASTTDICAAAKLTRPTLYHYFGSKRGLLLAVHMQLLDDFKPLIAQAGSIADPLERLVYMIRAYTRDICSHPELRVLIHDTLIINDRHFREVREVWKTHYILLRDTISQLKSEKRISQYKVLLGHALHPGHDNVDNLLV
jgi:AcrR family transcriptional regulator